MKENFLNELSHGILSYSGRVQNDVLIDREGNLEIVVYWEKK